MSIEVESRLTVYFDDPFWVGVFEEIEDNQLSVCRVVFGAEPKEMEVYNFIQTDYYRLKFSHPIENGEREYKKRINPKRLQRQVKKLNSQNGIRTKAQEALQQSYEANKIVRKKLSKEKREAEKALAFQKKQEKKKQKKRGH